MLILYLMVYELLKMVFVILGVEIKKKVFKNLGMFSIRKKKVIEM